MNFSPRLMLLVSLIKASFDMCFGGSAPPSPAAPASVPPPAPQLAATPTAVRASTVRSSGQQYGSTLLTGGLGDPISSQTLGAKTLLGQ
jgi:hypothetical protein